MKQNKDQEYWPRLTSCKQKNPHISVDWAKWVDEDDLDQKKETL